MQEKKVIYKEVERKIYSVELKRDQIKDFYNREVKEKKCKEMLNVEGGWDPAKAGSIDVAKIVNPNSPDDGSFYHWDGGHRMKMHELQFPDIDSAPPIKANVTEVSEKKEISALYAGKNEQSQAHSADETFVHSWNAGLQDEVNEKLKECGLKVDPNPKSDQKLVAGDPTGPNIKIKSFTKMVDDFQFETVKKATSLLKDIFPKHDNLTSELFEGLCYAISYVESFYEKLGEDAPTPARRMHIEAFRKALTNAAVAEKYAEHGRLNGKTSLKSISNYFKLKGGNLHAKSGPCFTLGILEICDGNKLHRKKDIQNQLSRQLNLYKI